MLTTGDGIWIFIICVGIPLGYGIGYFGPLLILDLWAHHKKDCGGPHMHVDCPKCGKNNESVIG